MSTAPGERTSAAASESSPPRGASLPELSLHTVTVTGPGRRRFTYVMNAAEHEAACALALVSHFARHGTDIRARAISDHPAASSPKSGALHGAAGGGVARTSHGRGRRGSAGEPDARLAAGGFPEADVRTLPLRHAGLAAEAG